MSSGSKKSRAQKRAEERLERVAAAGETLAATGRKMNRDPTLLAIMRSVRAVLPGDSRVADPGELGAAERPKAVGRMLAEISTDRPGVLGEAGLGALQAWQAISEAQGRGRGKTDLAIVFTDLVDFSDWALEAGDEAAVKLLRDVSVAVEPPVKSNDGTVVKRLGDGMMAVFKSATRRSPRSRRGASAWPRSRPTASPRRSAPASTAASRARSARTTSESTSTSPPASPTAPGRTSCCSRPPPWRPRPRTRSSWRSASARCWTPRASPRSSRSTPSRSSSDAGPDADLSGDGAEIPLGEIELRASRSSGPGGQHANVTASRIEAVFDVASSPSLERPAARPPAPEARRPRHRRRPGRPQPGPQPRAGAGAAAGEAGRGDPARRSAAADQAGPSREATAPRREEAHLEAQGAAAASAVE